MSDESLIQALLDIVIFVRPDGVITHQLGGRQMPFLRDTESLAGRRLEDALDPEVAVLIARLVRRTLTTREGCEAEFLVEGATYRARLTAQGPRRALCVISHVAAAAARDSAGDTALTAESTERRGFMRRFQASVADAALRERPLAVCMIFLGGLLDIGRLIDFSIGERVLSDVLRELPASDQTQSDMTWYVGQLGEDLLGVVVDGSVDRERVRAVVVSLCEAIARPVRVGDASFRLAPCAGIALLGQDASRSSVLLNHARAAMLESRRSGDGTVQFYSDTLRMLPVARLDIARELRMAIGAGQIGLRYVLRHDLASARVTAIQAYMRWTHPLQGEIPPAQFLPIADATGLALAVSRAGLEQLAADLGGLRGRYGGDLPVSFGALRQHVASGKLARDCSRLLPANELASGRLELRIAERTLATLSRPERALGAIAECGALIIVDELGRGASSLARLPQLPIWGLQIDLDLVVAASRGTAALRSCRAIGALAQALEIVPIAAGIDDDAVRTCMLGIGCAQGFGDLYASVGEIAPAAQNPKVALS
jgi:predicted signal transduction protein with EAL and GGDEF domain